ncbi:flagellar hook-basal body complex protein FliE [Iodidimonas sp. SYSU 1G8]|uniref:flagellar hook-basal body complex protein FliE n=1 Tax=Iodidimonas sp. SYSU 1G8 TaxID=3133967 RepID=UPI0031FE53D0
MSVGSLDAAMAYGRIARTPQSGASSSEAAPAGEAGFGDMLSSMVTNAASSMRASEAASARQVAGKGDLIDVVTAIGAAEMALDTVVAVRDRVVGAYSEIMRMQI